MLSRVLTRTKNEKKRGWHNFVIHHYSQLRTSWTSFRICQISIRLRLILCKTSTRRKCQRVSSGKNVRWFHSDKWSREDRLKITTQSWSELTSQLWDSASSRIHIRSPTHPNRRNRPRLKLNGRKHSTRRNVSQERSKRQMQWGQSRSKVRPDS